MPTPEPAIAEVALHDRGVVTHELKIWPEHYQALKVGAKRAEVRKDDRDFRAHDLLDLRKVDPETLEPTGAWMSCRITHILRGAEFGIMPGYAVLSVSVQDFDV